MTGRDVNGRDGLSGRRQGAGALRAVPSAQQPEIPGRHPSGTCRGSPQRRLCGSSGQHRAPARRRSRRRHLPDGGPGIPAASAPAIHRPEVETFRSARRTGAICGSRLTAQGDQEFHGRQAATAPGRLTARRGAA
jgi:hypothetical protein